MNKYTLHKKQKKFLTNYLKYWFPYFPISDMAHDRVTDIVDVGTYYDNDRELLNRIRKECRHKVMKDGDGLFTPIPLKYHQHIYNGQMYAPYIPMMITPAPSFNSFTPPKGLMKRYAKKPLKPGLYGNVKISNEPNKITS